MSAAKILLTPHTTGQIKKLPGLPAEAFDQIYTFHAQQICISRTNEQFLSVMRDFLLLLSSIRNYTPASEELNTFIDLELMPLLSEFIIKSKKTIDPSDGRLNKKLSVGNLRFFLAKTQHALNEKLKTDAFKANPVTEHFVWQLQDHIKESLLFYTGHVSETFRDPDTQKKTYFPAFKDASQELADMYHRFAKRESHSPALAIAHMNQYAYYIAFVTSDIIAPTLELVYEPSKYSDAELEEPLVKKLREFFFPGAVTLSPTQRITLARCYNIEMGLRISDFIKSEYPHVQFPAPQEGITPIEGCDLKISRYKDDVTFGLKYMEETSAAFARAKFKSPTKSQLSSFLNDVYVNDQRLLKFAKTRNPVTSEEKPAFIDRFFNPTLSDHAILERKKRIETKNVYDEITKGPRIAQKAKVQFYFCCAMNYLKASINRFAMIRTIIDHTGPTGAQSGALAFMSNMQRNVRAEPAYESCSAKISELAAKIKKVHIPLSWSEIMRAPVLAVVPTYARSDKHRKNVADVMQNGDQIPLDVKPRSYFGMVR